MFKGICIALHLCSTISGHGYAIDGDTIVVEGYHVRISGLDAEELNEPHGLEAKYAMIRLLHGTIRCELTGDRSYNRYVGTCFNDSGDLASQMAANGAALDCARYSGGKYRQYEPSNIRLKLVQKPYCN